MEERCDFSQLNFTLIVQLVISIQAHKLGQSISELQLFVNKQNPKKMSRVSRGDSTKNRIHLHYKLNKDSAPKTIRFFKVMFGKDHDKLMFLPPKIAPIMQQFSGKELVLKDPGGRRWPVLLSKVNGGLAFTSGWASFFCHHNLEESSFLTFEYEEESNFLFTRVYENSGCEANQSMGPREPEETEENADTVEEIIEVNTPPHDKKHNATERVSDLEKASGSKASSKSTLKKGPFFKMKSREISVGRSSVGVKKIIKYQELPVPVPTIKKYWDLGQVIYLKDPKGWVWPFLSQDKQYVKLLAGKWKKFCNENNITERDECMFEVEDADLGIYRVNVIAPCSN